MVLSNPGTQYMSLSAGIARRVVTSTSDRRQSAAPIGNIRSADFRSASSCSPRLSGIV